MHEYGWVSSPPIRTNLFVSGVCFAFTDPNNFTR